MKVLVIGAGYWGPNIVRNLIDFPEVESIGICDLDPARAEKLVRTFPRTHVARSVPDAFADGYDATFIVTPVETHAALAMQALRAGLHTFIEKPLTRTVAEGEDLIACAKQSGKRLMVGHVFHYKPAVRMLADLARSGELGSIKYFDSVRVNLGLFRPDVNVMWDLAPHDLSIFEVIIGKAPVRVSAVGACHVPHPTTPQATMAHMVLDYGDGCLGHVHVNWYSPLKQRLLVVAGDKKMAVYDDLNTGEPIHVYDRGTYDPVADTPMYPSLRTGHTFVPYVKTEEPLKIQIREFFQAIAEGREPQTDGEAGLRIVRILEAAMTSLEQDGRFIEVPSTSVPAGAKEMLSTTEGTRRIRDVSVGERCRINDFVNLYECEIGDETMIGTFVEIQRGVRIGKRCKIQSHSFICEGVTIEDGVFIGHGVIFTNDRYPRSVGVHGELLKSGDWTLEKTIVRRGASIGSGAVILPGLEIGEGALVGAGAVVVKSVPAGAVVAGVPARLLRYVDKPVMLE